MDYTATLTMMRRAAEKAGRGLVRDFGEVENLQVSRKGPRDFVSIADTNAERSIIRDLQKARPDYKIIGEESGEVNNDTVEHMSSEYTFIVDPLDGTTNFLHGIPHFAVSIGLEHNGELVAGVVYDPIKDEMYHACKGGGAFVNDRRLRVSARVNLGDCLFASGFIPLGNSTPDDLQDYLKELESVQLKAVNVRRMGSAALDLCWVASGRVDGYWQKGLQPWDCAAGIIIAKEAGAFVTSRKGTEYKHHKDSYIVVANNDIHRDFLKLIKNATK